MFSFGSAFIELEQKKGKFVISYKFEIIFEKKIVKLFKRRVKKNYLNQVFDYFTVIK